jgi:hypothetical protein
MKVGGIWERCQDLASIYIEMVQCIKERLLMEKNRDLANFYLLIKCIMKDIGKMVNKMV